MRCIPFSIDCKLQTNQSSFPSKSTPPNPSPFKRCMPLPPHASHASSTMTYTTDRPSFREPAPASSSSSSSLFGRPAASVGSRWMDIQGIRDWVGMLDPLDDNLRAEIIRYGYFVEAAYRSCEFNPGSPSYGQCKHSKKKLLVNSGFARTGYRVTKHLSATSGIQLIPNWFEMAPSWMSSRSSWIGYVAVCKDKRVISKLGRRDVVISFRGTATIPEWLENLRATLTPISGETSGGGSESLPMVETGFFSLYNSKTESCKSLQDLLREEIGKILSAYGNEPLSFTFTGHSLGAALATVAAYDIKDAFKFKSKHLVTVISFGGPRVGNRTLRCRLEEQGTKVLRIVNSDDLVTKLPGFVLDNNGSGGELGDDDDDDGVAAAILEDDDERWGTGAFTRLGLNNLTGWVQKVVEDSQLVYADVGCELRLSGGASPYPNAVEYFAACHELKTYLHLVDGFVGSGCPFRATARKIMNSGC